MYDFNLDKYVFFNMAPLLLYEDVSNGTNLLKPKKSAEKKLAQFMTISEENDDGANHVNVAERYGLEIFMNFKRNQKKISLSKDVIVSTLTNENLRRSLTEELSRSPKSSNSPETFRRAFHFEWKFDREDYNEMKRDEDGSVASQEMCCDDGTIFYLQIVDLRNAGNENDGNRGAQSGRIMVVLHETNTADERLENVAFDLECKQLGRYYTKFSAITFDASESGIAASKHYQGGYFNMRLLKRAFEEKRKDHILWKFAVSF